MASFGDFLDIQLIWRDTTAHGSILSGRLQDTVRRALYPRTLALLRPEIEKSPEFRVKVSASDLVRVIHADRESEHHARIIGDPAFWRPDASSVAIDRFTIVSEECETVVTLSEPAIGCDALRHWLRTGETDEVPLIILARMLQRTIEESTFRRQPLDAGCDIPVMIGHACVSWSDGSTRLWTDPFFRPKRLRYSRGQQPLSTLDAPEDRHVVLVTHGHPDHFSPASLLLFPRDTTILVPRVEHETPLSFDLERRARELGFHDVHSLARGDQFDAGAFHITAWPFFGEQPLGRYGKQGKVRDRNVGVTYHVTGPSSITALFLADSGSDPDGSIMKVAREIRSKVGAVDLVFGNHRRWRVYPAQFLTTSVPQSLCYVPDSELAVPQTTMLTPEELIEVAEALSARQVIPYAMGDAPWFAEIGLGLPLNHKSAPTSFDSSIAELTATDQDTLVKQAAEIAQISPGDHVDLNGRVPGKCSIPRGPSAPIQTRVFSPPRAFAIECNSSVVCDLLELTRLDPNSYLVAADGFAEFGTSDPLSLPFVAELVKRLVPSPHWQIETSAPVTAGTLAHDRNWLSHFERCQQAATVALRNAHDDLSHLSSELSTIRAMTCSGAVEAIAADYLGLTLTIAPFEILRRPGDEESIPLAEASKDVRARYGAAATLSAFLIVKILHNLASTARVLGRPYLSTESEVFAKTLH